MSNRFWLPVFVLVLGALFSVVAEEAAKKSDSTEREAKLPERGFELPKVTVRGVGAPVSIGSNVALMCSVNPPIATGVEATAYHVKPNGDWMLMSHVSFITDSLGKAVLTMGPPNGQWRAGKAVIVVSPNSWPQMREQLELQFVGNNVNQEFVSPPIVAAQVVCNVSEDAELTTVVRQGQRVLIRGFVDVEDLKEGQFGPPVMVDLWTPEVIGGVPRQLNAQSGVTMSVGTKDGRFGFEIEMKVPDEPKNYQLKIKSLLGSVVDARKSPDSVERIISVKPEARP